jgi:predicted metal-dependent phosphoesterase TrpH
MKTVYIVNATDVTAAARVLVRHRVWKLDEATQRVRAANVAKYLYEVGRYDTLKASALVEDLKQVGCQATTR